MYIIVFHQTLERKIKDYSSGFGGKRGIEGDKALLTPVFCKDNVFQNTLTTLCPLRTLRVRKKRGGGSIFD